MAKKKVRASENIGLFLFFILGMLFGAVIAVGITGISTLGQGLSPIDAEGPISPCQGTFLQHCDTPNSYTGHALDVVTVKSNERGLEFTDRSAIDTRCDVPGLCQTVHGINADFTNNIIFWGEIMPDGRPCSPGQILQHVGINDWDCVWPEGISDCGFFTLQGSHGPNTCTSHGYDVCLFEEYYKQTTYLDSNDGSCEGQIQSRIIYPEFRECPVGGSGSDLGCAHASGAEPRAGDVLQGDYVDMDTGLPIIPSRVLCCR